MLMKVKIINCQQPTYWYKNEIGSIRVIDTTHRESGGSYSVMDSDGKLKGLFLDHRDIDINYQIRKERRKKLKKINENK